MMPRYFKSGSIFFIVLHPIQYFLFMGKIYFPTIDGMGIFVCVVTNMRF